MENKSYGEITVAHDSKNEKKLGVIDFVQANYIDNRTITISTIEDDSICLIVENQLSTGRNPQQSIWLSKESFISLLSTAHLYIQVKEINLSEDIKSCVEGGKLQYSFSDNLKPLHYEE